MQNSIHNFNQGALRVDHPHTGRPLVEIIKDPELLDVQESFKVPVALNATSGGSTVNIGMHDFRVAAHDLVLVKPGTKVSVQLDSDQEPGESEPNLVMVQDLCEGKPNMGDVNDFMVVNGWVTGYDKGGVEVDPRDKAAAIIHFTDASKVRPRLAEFLQKEPRLAQQILDSPTSVKIDPDKLLEYGQVDNPKLGPKLTPKEMQRYIDSLAAKKISDGWWTHPYKGSSTGVAGVHFAPGEMRAAEKPHIHNPNGDAPAAIEVFVPRSGSMRRDLHVQEPSRLTRDAHGDIIDLEWVEDTEWTMQDGGRVYVSSVTVLPGQAFLHLPSQPKQQVVFDSASLNATEATDCIAIQSPGFSGGRVELVRNVS